MINCVKTELDPKFLEFVELAEKDGHEIVVYKVNEINIQFSIDDCTIFYYKEVKQTAQEFYKDVLDVIKMWTELTEYVEYMEKLKGKNNDNRRTKGRNIKSIRNSYKGGKRKKWQLER